jgi:hypothetical protein
LGFIIRPVKAQRGLFQSERRESNLSLHASKTPCFRRLFKQTLGSIAAILRRVARFM